MVGRGLLGLKQVEVKGGRNRGRLGTRYYRVGGKFVWACGGPNYVKILNLRD